METERDFRRWQRRIQVAQGNEPADVVLAGAHILNVFTQKLVRADVAIVDGTIAGVGNYSRSRSRIDYANAVIAPSFIDAHMHIESSMLWIPEFARAVVRHGTGAVIADPHEIANVAGIGGVAAMRAAAHHMPMQIRWTAPSCVPASQNEHPGATFTLADVAETLSWPESVGLGEMMNFPGTLAGDRMVFNKLRAASDVPHDGHGPGLTGSSAQAYAAAGIGSDHESTTLEEASAKLEAGMMLMLRQGSSERNVLDLLPLVDDATWHRCCFASDDRDAHDLATRGHVDDILRTVIDAGLDPVRALTMASWNAAQHWRMWSTGAIAPGYDADLVILEAGLDDLTVTETWFRGNRVAARGELIAAMQTEPLPAALTESVHLAPLEFADLTVPERDRGKAVGVIPNQITTTIIDIDATHHGASHIQNPERDLLKLVCAERHHATGRVGAGLVVGFGLKSGAIAGSIAHDAHNIIAVGASDSDILAAIAAVANMQGGLVVVESGQVVASMTLTIAGLMSDQPLKTVARQYDAVESAARSLGSQLDSPFGQLAFLGLSVIPEARVTDRGFLIVG
jgi:adenine deaminase